MKTVLLVTLLLGAVTADFVRVSDHPDTSVSHSNNMFEFRLSGFDQSINAGMVDYKIQGEAHLDIAGKPELPVIRRSVALPGEKSLVFIKENVINIFLGGNR